MNSSQIVTTVAEAAVALAALGLTAYAVHRAPTGQAVRVLVTMVSVLVALGALLGVIGV